ncbi:MAG: PspC domain-containing protein [Firmicutes bacterium]|jgi:phage shock protein C|nr:PspC domain-containing protein [Bacillota bacterium]MCI5832485.1 PspC domain-containing protein [Clostridiales bacterium]
MNGKKLYRSDENKMLAGVCGGIAEYFGVDPTLIRLAWVVFSLLGGSGLLAYILAAIIIPRDDSNLYQ